MQILVLGGTVFLGRHVVEAALAAGHSVTLLTRGLTQPELFPEAEHVVANRDGGLSALPPRRWDLILDTCGFVPRVVQQSVALSWERYLFVSSVSAYLDQSRPNEEDSPMRADPPEEDVDLYYGALKAACERVVLAAGGEVVRPGLIVGPHDPTGRFSYWPSRLAEGGTVLAPGPAEQPVQVIDVRDLARWLVERPAGTERIFNAVGDIVPLGTVLETIRMAVGGEAELCWREEGLEGLEPWGEMPLWLGTTKDHWGMAQTSNARARATGLRFRPLAETAEDTLAWARTLTGDPPRQVDGRYRPQTLSREKEAEILGRTVGKV